VKYNGLLWTEKVERREGRNCPSCGRFLKIYHRKLSSSMAYALIRLYGLHAKFEKEYFHVRDFYRERGDFAKLKFWGLVEEAPNMSEDKKSSGLWKITDQGIRFAILEIRVPEYVITKWGSEALGFAGPAVTIEQCLRKKFNYSELMGSMLKEA